MAHLISAERYPGKDRIARLLPLLHGAFLATGGIWAVTNRRFFERVMGPKTDYWLVRTVGGLLTTSALVLVRAHLHARLTPEIRALAIGTSGVLAAIDVIYVAKRRIRPIYLLDGAANLAFIAGWLACAPRTPASDSGFLGVQSNNRG